MGYSSFLGRTSITGANTESVSVPYGSNSFTFNCNCLAVGAHLLSATNPENGTVNYTYNSNHLLATKTDANAQQGNYTLSYSYDGLNRLSTVTQTAPQTPTGTTATFVKLDATTKGNWRSSYGADGYVVIGDQSSNPSYVTPTASGQLQYVWASTTTDVRGLQKGFNPADRIAATWYNSTPFTISLNFSDTAQHQIALYCVDWDTTTRQQRVEILDTNGNVLNGQDVSSFNGGIYLVWKVTGHITIRVTSTAGINAVVSGLFFAPVNTGGGGSTVLRTYHYDTNQFDASYSQYSVGRLTAVEYPVINYDTGIGSGAPYGSTTFIDMFSYDRVGHVTGKRLRVTKAKPYFSNGQYPTQTAVGDLNLSYSYNNEGKGAGITYPTDAYGNTPSFYYSFDGMMRLAGMNDQGNAAVVSGVQYGPANELTSITYNGVGTETRQYNSMLQLTSISGMGQNVTYTFPAGGANAGKIDSQRDNISGEAVSYLYDSLNRLTSAAGSGWGQTFTYDGFGNLTNRAGTGTAPTMSTPVNSATNQLSGYTYDLNGNQKPSMSRFKP
jgi:YD repeat-containing protein